MIAYSFETGADRFVDQTTLSVASSAGATGVRVGQPERVHAGRQGHGRLRACRRRRRGRCIAVPAQNPPSPAPNITFTQPLPFAHAAGAVLRGRTSRRAGSASSRTTPPRASFEALEFAAGNYGLLESAYEYSKDDKGPEVIMTVGAHVEHADHDDVPVRQRAVGDPLHDRRVEADNDVDAVGLDGTA